MKNPCVGQDVVWQDRPGPVISCTEAEDRCRQEYALQADLAYQVQRFGVGHHGDAGTVDFDAMDLTHALDLVARSNQAWLELPKVVRDRYMTWQNVEKAAQTGELQQLLGAAGAADGGSSAASVARASESAPVSGEKPA